jgi:hypothetical protein
MALLLAECFLTMETISLERLFHLWKEFEVSGLMPQEYGGC